MSHDQFGEGHGRPGTRYPTIQLGWRLLVSVVAYPVVALGFISLAVIGGTTVITTHDVRTVSLTSGVAALFALSVLMATWWQETTATQRRWPHYVMTTAAVSVVIGATAYFALL
jgi:hypothetical protein